MYGLFLVLSSLMIWMQGCGEPSPEPYFQQLKSRDPAARQEAAFELMRFGNEIVPRLIEEAESEHARVRFLALQLLGRSRDLRAVPVLIRALNDNSSGVAEKAAWALGTLKDQRAVSALTRALNHKSVKVAQQAAWALGELRAPESLPALLAYAHDASIGVRQEVVRALGTCHSYEQEPVLSDSAYKEVVSALGDWEPDVRISALMGMREFGYRNAAEKIIRMFQDPAPEVRHVVVQALGQIATGDAPHASGQIAPGMRDRIVEILIAALDEIGYQSIRTKAIRALGDIRDPQVIPHLERLQQEGGEEDSREATRALQKIRETKSGRVS